MPAGGTRFPRAIPEAPDFIDVPGHSTGAFRAAITSTKLSAASTRSVASFRVKSSPASRSKSFWDWLSSVRIRITRRAGLPSRESKSTPGGMVLPITTIGPSNPPTRALGTARPSCHPLGDISSRSQTRRKKRSGELPTASAATVHIWFCRAVDIRQIQLVRNYILQLDGPAPANQKVYCGSRNHRGEQGHDDKSHKQGFPNQRVLERQQPENYLHRAARVHGQADSH